VRWTLAALSIVVGCAAGLPRLRVDASNEAYFVEGDDARVRYERFERTFGSDELVYVLVDVGADAFEPAHLERLIELGRELRRLPHAIEVRSPLHAPFPLDVDGTLSSRSVERSARGCARSCWATRPSAGC
jgi:predicted RND superfamily exporter protein